MRHFSVKRFLLVVLFTSVSCTCVWAQSRQSTPLTNASIVKLVRAGFKEKTIVSIIGTRAPNFDLSPERMIDLKRSGVSERVILAMLSRQQGVELGDDSWSDDTFFDEGLGMKSKDSGKQPDTGSGSVDIFGSSGGVRGSSRSRGVNGSVSGDTETTGSATVRIIRPPAEAGAQLKLDNPPPLTNDSIIELVEAGFSEGTIVRRIEQSPVEFDLSPEKLAELRKHLVSDKILAAMKTAMGDDSSLSKTAPASASTSNATRNH
jgi:hypothetical protein